MPEQTIRPESRTLLRLTALYKAALEIGFALLPLLLVAYLYFTQSPASIFHDHLTHEVVSGLSVLLSLFAGWLAWRCFQASGEPALRYVTLAFLCFALVYAPHGLLTRMDAHNTWLFLLFGPASRVVMTLFLLEALLRHGEAAEPPERRRDPITWGGWLAGVVVLNMAVAGLAHLPEASDSRIRLVLEGFVIAMAVGGIAVIRWRRLKSGLMGAYQVALVAYAISSAAFLLSPPWSHLWWLAHAIFATGFFILSHGLTRVLLTTRSIAGIRSEAEMVTRLESAEDAAAASHEAEVRLKALLEKSPVGVLVTNPDGRVLFCNRRHAEILGLPPDQVLGRNANDFHADSELRHLKVAEALSTGRTVSAEIECIPAAGPRRWHMVSWTPTAFAGRSALVAWGLDVTDRHAAAEALLQAKQAAEAANRAKTQFLAAVSHELRTPLNAISGFAETMQAQLLGPLGNSHYLSYCGHIVDAARHLTGLINDVLDVSRVESGTLSLGDERVVVADLTSSVMVMMGERARQAGLKLDLELARGLPDLRGDPLRLKQVLLNLLSNAVKFTPDSGRVILRAHRSMDEGVLLEVEDTGIGISPQDQEKVLAAFVQVDGRLERRYQGMGLGLSLARSLMELHGGTLTLNSAPGRGTLVRLSFPADRTLPVMPLPDSAVG